MIQNRKYLIDSSIWIDLYENRNGYTKEPLGDFAWKLFSLIKANKNKIVISDLLFAELSVYYSDGQLRGMFTPFKDIIERIFVKAEQKHEAEKIAISRNIPKGDVLHAIMARENNLILITRDNHFRKLEDISKHYKPEEII